MDGRHRAVWIGALLIAATTAALAVALVLSPVTAPREIEVTTDNGGPAVGVDPSGQHCGSVLRPEEHGALDIELPRVAKFPSGDPFTWCATARDDRRDLSVRVAAGGAALALLAGGAAWALSRRRRSRRIAPAAST